MFVREHATILHADADAFFASVEQRDDPALRGRPVIVGGGVVMAASYEARACGVRGAMGGARARRLCPDAVVVPPRFSAYLDASRALFEVFRDTAPEVEGLSLEEAFLDVRGLERISGTPAEIASRLRRATRERVGLAVTVGVARTKVLAKIASAAAKPDGLLVVEGRDERAFLRPLAVERLWGVGKATAQRLHRHEIRTVGDLADLDEAAVVAIVGRAAGRHLHAIANNRDPRPVRARRGRRSIGSQCALSRASHTDADLDQTLCALADRVTRRMRSARRAGRTIVLRIRFGDFRRATRSHTLAQATAQTAVVLAVARALLAAAMPAVRDRGVTLLGIAVTNLTPPGSGLQLALPLDRAQGRAPALDAALDQVRAQFGAGAVTRATLVGRGDRLSPALLAEAEPDASS
jgi:DNA polymerase IV